jgi:two-component system nitrate/nitrite response regulator NarL
VKKIIVCSRHALLVAGFRALVAEPAGLVVFHCSEIQDLRSCFEANQPDLALIDVNTGANPQFLAELRPLAPHTGLILWVDKATPEFVHQVLGFGVLGVLRKDATTDLYAQCLDRVSAHKLWLENDMTQKMLSMKTVRLSPRERQLVALLTQGLRNKEIAWRMNITEGTTKVYLSRLFEKTGANDRFELAMFVLQNLENGAGEGSARSLPAF